METSIETVLGPAVLGGIPEGGAWRASLASVRPEEGVEEIVLSAFQGKSLLLPFYGKALRKRADECLELTHATNLRKESFRELSGGQKQRVLLARALCAAERLLLLDEPVTGLDPESSQNMYNIIKDLHEQKKMTIVMVSHDVEAAKKYATRILNFNEIAQ